AALLAGLNHMPLKFFQFCLARLDHAAARPQGDKYGRTQFSQFFHQELGPVPFRQGGSYFESEANFTLGTLRGPYVKLHVPTVDAAHPGGILPAIAVEQANPVSRPQSANRGKMVSLRPLECERPWG